MLRNYLKTALRNLWKNKGFSAINILGLTIGMASSLLIPPRRIGRDWRRRYTL